MKNITTIILAAGKSKRFYSQKSKVLQEIAPSMADASVGGNVYNWATDPDNVALLGKNTFFGKLASVGKEFVGNVGAFAKTSGLDQISGYVDIINPSKSFLYNNQSVNSLFLTSIPNISQ